jgi:hypothetical protein
MDNQQRTLFLEACREAYLCLRDRNRPMVNVGTYVVHADAELAECIRVLARQMLALTTERDALLREVQALRGSQRRLTKNARHDKGRAEQA